MEREISNYYVSYLVQAKTITNDVTVGTRLSLSGFIRLLRAMEMASDSLKQSDDRKFCGGRFPATLKTESDEKGQATDSSSHTPST